jgi:hypothetical protein
VSAAAPAVTTPTVRAGVRRVRYWLVAIAFLLVVAVVTLLLTRGTGEGAPLSPDSPTPEGSRAIVEVLRDSGVDVDTATSFGGALPAAAGATVLLYDPGHFLDEARMTELGDASDRLILVQPDAMDLGALAPGVVEDEDGFATEPVPVEDECATASVRGVGPLWLDGAAYDAPSGGCYEVAEGRYSLVDAGDTVVLGSLLPLQNETVVREGNAAFALRLLGADDRLVWYLPGPLDVDAALAPTLGELTPAWLPPVSGLLVLAGVAAMVWRGRRFGPLVVENLPVVVRSSETMEGRARLYENTSARGRALDALRLGTLERLAARLGLPRAASVDEIVDATAGALRTDAAALRPLLIEHVPTSDADLVALSDDLLRLERSVDEATRAR